MESVIGDSIYKWVVCHSHVEIGVAQPLDCIFDICHRSKGNLGIQIISETLNVLTLDGVLLGEEGQVMSQLIMQSDDCTMSKCVVLWSTSSSKNLHYIQDSKVNHGALLCVIYIRSLDDDSVCRKVDTPGQGGRAHQALDMSFSEESFHKISILSQHASVMGAKSFREQIFQRLIS